MLRSRELKGLVIAVQSEEHPIFMDFKVEEFLRTLDVCKEFSWVIELFSHSSLYSYKILLACNDGKRILLRRKEFNLLLLLISLSLILNEMYSRNYIHRIYKLESASACGAYIVQVKSARSEEAIF